MSQDKSRGPVLILDLGTSGLKAVLFGQNATLIASAECPIPDLAEPYRQSPTDWWAAAVKACGQLPLTDVAAICLTGTMENLITIGPPGTEPDPAILYGDPCGAKQLERFGQSDFGTKKFAAITGNEPEPLMTAFKLGWLRENHPASFGSARWFLPGAKDYLVFKMTGRAVTDPTCATTTGLMDLRSRRWSTELLDHFKIDPARLPELRPAEEIVGPLAKEAANELGVQAGIPVINGCGDAGATTLGAGATASGQTSLYLGTSGWVAQVSALPGSLNPAPTYRLAHPLGDGIINIAPVLSAGAATKWARDTLGLDIKSAENAAIIVDENPAEIVFLPYLGGERFPFLDLEVRAGFLGVSARDGPGALYYAVLEGVAFAIAANLEAMSGPDNGSLKGPVRLVGGGAKSAIWPQIIADILNCEVEIAPHPLAATALGAYRIACQALKWPDASPGDGSIVFSRQNRRGRLERQNQRFADATRFARALG